MEAFQNKWKTVVKNFGTYHDLYMKSHHSMMRFLINIHDKSTPNILMICRRGFPLDLLLKEAMRRVFQLERIPYPEHCEIYENEIPYKHCQYYFEMDFDHPDMPRDCSKIVDLIKYVSSTKPIMGERHIWILKNVERIRRDYGLESFRVLLERFSQNALFLCTSYRPSALDISLRSRFIYLRVPLLAIAEIHEILSALQCEPEKIKTLQTNNLFKAVCLSCLTEIYPSHLHYPPILEIKSWTIDIIRRIAHEYCNQGLTLADACMDIINILPPKKSRHDILQTLANIEHRFNQGSRIREMWYIEQAFVEIFI